MSVYDVREYLEKVYGITTVRQVRTAVQEGAKERHPQQTNIVVSKKEDEKIAWVTLRKDEVFVFPNITDPANDPHETHRKTFDRMNKRNQLDTLKAKSKGGRAGVVDWFPV